jgi:hypothetical protein
MLGAAAAAEVQLEILKNSLWVMKDLQALLCCIKFA